MSTSAQPESLDPAETVRRHAFYEDVLALVMGTALVALGLTLYAKASLGTGGIAGIALLGQYASGIGFGTIFFVVNLPFYILAVRRMGWPYTLRTFAAVALISVLAMLTPRKLKPLKQREILIQEDINTAVNLYYSLPHMFEMLKLLPVPPTLDGYPINEHLVQN